MFDRRHVTLTLHHGLHKRQFTEPSHKGRIYYDETVHNATCIHMVQGQPCGRYCEGGNPHNWLCPQHQSQLNPKEKLGTIVLTPEEQILMESERLHEVVAKLRLSKPRLEPTLWRAVPQDMEPVVWRALHPTIH